MKEMYYRKTVHPPTFKPPKRISDSDITALRITEKDPAWRRGHEIKVMRRFAYCLPFRNYRLVLQRRIVRNGNLRGDFVQ